MRKTLLTTVTAVAIAVSLAGCNLTTVTKDITDVNNEVTKYAPIIGKDLLMVGNIVVQAYCSPIIPAGGQVAVNVLNIVASNSAAATTVAGILAANATIANQLCPLAKAVNAVVGTIPNGQPTQTITPAVSTTVKASAPLPVYIDGKLVK